MSNENNVALFDWMTLSQIVLVKEKIDLSVITGENCDFN